ncbi:Transcriptional regulator PhnF [Candidatus Rhodobacter oscarellae]|uniref:Transcriptional regulator PhnF n=1 Tax=Candidatus Rhodobacter oscarellae TaxID=1675527 RepID=A0A0J9GW19_9RHOB|nr:phosphonate metabolism transcriptional regulator PhnF [Candidatus Rhodobacter lobularis]KMW57758.1 Transcriptional regulator PhnF [Candidatus Rhodobacter lobularis]
MTKNTWTQIKDQLTTDIRSGRLSAGDQLPTEPQLVARFGVGRHSVRKALEALAREGKLSIEQGRGTFVNATPRLTYQIGKRTRLRRNLIPQGVTVSSQLLDAGRIHAPENVSQSLHLDPGALVVHSQRITSANDVPVAFGSSYYCAARFPDFVERRDTLGSTTEAIRSYGIADYFRKSTSMHSRTASAEEARTLRQHPDVPVIVVHAVDASPDGTPLSCSRVIWSAARVTFTMEHSDD